MLLANMAPRRQEYEVFHLKHALASLVTLNLEEYFEEGESSEDAFWRGWYGFDSGSTTEGRQGLSQRRKLRFIYDYDTNSILVSNATPEQLSIIRGLIDVYDQPPSEESISARRFQIFRLEYAKAENVASTIKEVFRDLLSAKDTAFEGSKSGGNREGSTRNYYRVYGGESDKKPTKVKASFAGALSIGIDSTANMLIVSAQEEWMPAIADMIKTLDTEAADDVPAMKVIATSVDAETVRAAVARAMGNRSGSRGRRNRDSSSKRDGNRVQTATRSEP